jgi:hypothetical protein
MRNIKVTCRHCQSKINLDEAGEHLETCEASRHVHKAIKAEFAGMERVLIRVAAEGYIGYSEAS